jgi:hypothetical protein
MSLPPPPRPALPPMPPTWLAPAEQVPAAPPGPGVRAPFAAPPTERDRRRLWISLTIGAVLLLLCCGGGIVGFGALVVTTNKEIPVEARNVVNTYLSGLRDGDYRKSYDQLCADVQNRESEDDFAARVRAEPAVTSWTIDDVQVQPDTVTVETRRELSSGEDLRTYTLVSDQQAGGLRICGGE